MLHAELQGRGTCSGLANRAARRRCRLQDEQLMTYVGFCTHTHGTAPVLVRWSLPLASVQLALMRSGEISECAWHVSTMRFPVLTKGVRLLVDRDVSKFRKV
jgi:hypothetical protein